MKTTLKDVLKTIQKWQKENDVIFFGNLIEFDKKGDYKDGRQICFGDRKTLKIGLDEFNKMFNEDKKTFINW